MPPDSPYDASTASRYDQLRSWRGPVPLRLVDIARIRTPSRILDLGCGTGSLGLAIARIAGCSFVGLDVSRAMIRLAAGKAPHAAFALGDAAAMPFRAGSFDAVVGSFFLHHVAPPRRPDVARECWRVLESGQVVFVTSSHEHIEANPLGRFFPEFAAIDRERFPRIEEMMEWLERAGFTGIGSEDVLDAPRRIDRAYADWVEKKPISTLDLIGEDAFRRGMRTLREYVRKTAGKEEAAPRTCTLVYGEKPNPHQPR